MIRGTVSTRLEAIVRVVVRGPAGQEEVLEAVVDTGFSGALMLPQEVASRPGLRPSGMGRMRFADGTSKKIPLYDADVVWDDLPHAVVAECLPAAVLIGMSLMYGYDIHIEALDGGRVLLQKLP